MIFRSRTAMASFRLRISYAMSTRWQGKMWRQMVLMLTIKIKAIYLPYAIFRLQKFRSCEFLDNV